MLLLNHFPYAETHVGRWNSATPHDPESLALSYRAILFHFNLFWQPFQRELCDDCEMLECEMMATIKEE